MPNITRGSDLPGLLRYLVGPGRDNEHAEPHLVAGDQAMLSWWDDAELNADAARNIAAHLDAVRKRLDIEVAGGHVWHCSLSLKAEEGRLLDGKWAEVAEQFVDRMGFTESSGKAGCRWVAVRHGVSKAGNDHVHLVVSLVRNDGTKASTWNDRPRAQQVARDLEVEHGLLITAGRAAGVGRRGLKPAETARAVREQRVEPVRPDLERRVRAAAAAATSEAEFVRRLRLDRVLVHPRFAAGRADVVVGFSVADRPTRGERPVWYGGGRLARDLTLPRLRQGWPDTVEGATAAVGEWTAAGRNRRVIDPGTERIVRDPAKLHAAAGEIADALQRLRAVPVDDRAAWAAVAHDSAGVFAAWSRRLETAQPGPLAATAAQLVKSAQLRAYQTRTTTPAVQRGAGRHAAILLLQASGATPQRTGELLLLRQLSATMKAVHDAHQATGDAWLAAGIAAAGREHVVEIEARYTRAAEQTRAAQTGAARSAPGPGKGNSAGVTTGPRAEAPKLTDAERAMVAAHRAGAARRVPMPSPLPPRVPDPRTPGSAAVGAEPVRTVPGSARDRSAELD